MGLKENIVVVNEYTIKNSKGKGGSRGGTPGDYVLRYMARDGATEIATPVTLNNEDYILRYMARTEAVERVDTTEEEVRRDFERHQKYGGVAFGNKGSSLSHSDLIESSKSIQKAFDEGKTVMKTVISFDEDYLRKYGIIPEDFVFNERGDFRGNIDQMKLRYAIMNGMEYLGHDYDDLQYVGVIQVDTAHVHCHLAMVDMGRGNITEDGTQKGKLSANMKARIRRGIDLALDETKEIQYMASNVGIDRRNIQTNMRRYTYNQIIMYGAPQKLLTVLPDDERLWRSSTNRKEMQQANKICRDYVECILAKPNSGIKEAMQSIYDYVDARTAREELTREQQQKLIDNGREKIVDNCMNAVYATLRNIPESSREVNNDFLNMTASPIITPSFNGDAQDLVYKVHAYSARLSKHKKEHEKFTEYVKDYEEAEQIGNVNPAAAALYNYFLVEQEYQEKLVSKYSRMLFFDEPADDLTDEFIEVSKRAKTLNNMKALANDASAKKMKPENAEEYGAKLYGIYGGRFIVLDSDIFDKRIERYEKSYNTLKRSFDTKLKARNLQVQTDDDGKTYITKKINHPFDDVKGLDLHDLRGDFNGELEFSGYVKNSYMDMARRRIEAYDAACDYLRDSKQPAMIEAFDNTDIENMRFILDKLEKNEPVEPVEQPIMEVEEKHTVRLDRRMHRYMTNVVKNNVQSFEFTESLNLRDDSPDGRSDTDDWGGTLHSRRFADF